MKKKQFKKKDYKFRHDLGGVCVGYNMDWFTNGDGSFPSIDEEYDIAYDVFRKRQELLEVGEYFSMEIFGHKVFAYRNEEGIFTR